MPESEATNSHTRPSGALVFVSHDTRDAEIAEAFSKLLGSVSAGVLKSFRSSDKRGNQGIEYGVDWYPTIMEKLKNASDVVCLLTPHSTGRPWILYEAGVAKGQLDTPVHGLVLGMSLSEAGAGPFAQFQNCDDSEDAVTTLVMQLVARIPNAEPDRDVVIAQVKTFLATVQEVLTKQGHKEERPKKLDNSSVAKLFEEIKVMYQDLPGRIERRFDDEPRKNRKRHYMHPMRIHETLHQATLFEESQANPLLGVMIASSRYREEIPWLYDLVREAYIAEATGNRGQALELILSLEKSFDERAVHRLLDDYESKGVYMLVRELPEILHMISSVLKERSDSMGKSVRAAAGRNSSKNQPKGHGRVSSDD